MVLGLEIIYKEQKTPDYVLKEKKLHVLFMWLYDIKQLLRRF